MLRAVCILQSNNLLYLRSQWCSQFPDEEEVLFAPLTGLEVVGQPRVEGGTIVVGLRLNCNLRDLTIEQVTAKMKKTHTGEI